MRLHSVAAVSQYSLYRPAQVARGKDLMENVSMLKLMYMIIELGPSEQLALERISKHLAQGESLYASPLSGLERLCKRDQ